MRHLLVMRGGGVAMKITTNSVPRDLIDAWQLTAAERAEFDYLDWDAIEAGRDSATFFRYRGELYDLGEFMRGYGITHGSRPHLTSWDGYASDSAFSATVVRLVGDDQVIVGYITT